MSANELTISDSTGVRKQSPNDYTEMHIDIYFNYKQMSKRTVEREPKR